MNNIVEIASRLEDLVADIRMHVDAYNEVAHLGYPKREATVTQDEHVAQIDYYAKKILELI